MGGPSVPLKYTIYICTSMPKETLGTTLLVTKKNQFSKKADLIIQSTMTYMFHTRCKVKQLMFEVCMGLCNWSCHEPCHLLLSCNQLLSVSILAYWLKLKNVKEHCGLLNVASWRTAVKRKYIN